MTSILPVGDASNAELPGGMQPRRVPWREWLVGAGAAVLLALLVHRARRRAVAPPIPEEPVGPPQTWALVVLVVEDGQLVTQGDDLESHIAATTDERHHAVED